MRTAARTTGLISVAMCLFGLGLLGCGSAMVHTRADTGSLTANVSAVVSLVPRLGFGKGIDQRRTARRTGDTLIQWTGGRAILAEELTSVDPELISDSVRSLGEDPERTLTFSITAARRDRFEAAGSPVVGLRSRAVRRFSDYTVRLDVRRADRDDVLGSIETFATCLTSAPEIDSKGRPLGLQQAIDEATRKALKTFAPTLVPGAPFATLVEVPVRNDETAIAGAQAAIDKLRKLQALYPERSLNELAALASSDARFLVVSPGRLAALGIAKGDLISGMGGQTVGSRAALARALGRGATPAMTVARAGGQQLLIGQTLVARAK